MLDLDTGLGNLIVGQQLTPTDAVVSITRDGFRRADQAALASRTLGGKAMRAALNSGPMTPVAGVRRVICRPSLLIATSWRRSRSRSTSPHSGRNPGIGAQHEQAVIARLLGQLAGIDLERPRVRGGAQVAPVGGVADQRLVAPLQLLIERRNDRGLVGGVLLCLGFVATDQVAPPLSFDLLDEELRLLTPSAWDAQGRERLLVRKHHGAHQAVRTLARAQHVFEAALLQGGDGWGADHAAIGHHTDPTNGEAAAQAI